MRKEFVSSNPVEPNISWEKTDSSDVVKEKKEKDWFLFLGSFLNIAKCGCESSLGSRKFDLESKSIIVGVIFNIKHSLEILLKAINRKNNKKIDKSDYGHDLLRLMDFVSVKNINSAEKNKKEYSKCFENLKKIVIKYYGLYYVKEYLDKDILNIHDSDNCFFKYPENNNTFLSIDYSSLLSKATRADLLLIKDDIKLILEISKKIKKLI